MFFKLAVALVLVTLAYAQKPTPCESPRLWEGRVFSFDYYKQDLVRGRLSYDSIYKRERFIEEYRLGAEDDFYDVLYLHNEQVEYRFNLKTKECAKQPITRPWRDFGIPRNATNLGEAYIGSSSVEYAHLLATLWRDEFVDSLGNKVTYHGAWTLNACLPINTAFYSEADKLNTHTSFYDLTAGIYDPSIFIPRAECLKI